MSEQKIKRSDIFSIPLELLDVDFEWNSRTDYGTLEEQQDLKAFIKANGIPGIFYVGKKPDGRYLLTDGHRRYKALRSLIEEGFNDITFVKALFEPSKNQADWLLRQVIANSGKKFSAIDNAKLYKRYLAYGFSVKELSEKLAIPRSNIDQALLLGDAMPEMLDMIKNGELAVTTATAVLRETKDASLALEVVKKVKSEKEGNGKIKATEVTQKKSLKVRLVESVENAEPRSHEDGSVTLKFSREDYETFCDILGL